MAQLLVGLMVVTLPAVVAAAPASAGVPTDNVFPIAGRTRASAGCGDNFSPGGHEGTDCFAPHGTPLIAVEAGRIDYVRPYGQPFNCGTETGDGSGNRVSLSGYSGSRYYYGHLSAFAPGLAAGVTVAKGQLLGYLGETGNAVCTDPHLHFQIWDAGVLVAPYPRMGSWTAAGVGGGGNPGGAVSWNLHDANAGGGVEHSFTWGEVPESCQPMTGDWNGDGWDTVGVLCPVGGEWSWFMQDQHSGDATDYWFNWGSSGCVPIVGDWDGNGTDTPGTVCGSGGEWQWTLWNHNAGGGVSYQFNWGGNDGCWPIDGDWNGDGADSPGLLCPRGGEWEWVMSNHNATAGVDAHFRWGGTDCPARWGDWDGNNTDTPAVVCTLGNGELEWTQWNHNAGGGVSNAFRWGGAPQTPLVGDWNNDGFDTVGTTDMS